MLGSLGVWWVRPAGAAEADLAGQARKPRGAWRDAVSGQRTQTQTWR